MTCYEAVFIIRQDLNLEEIDKISDELSKIITDRNGKIEGQEYWGLRKLAYKINKSSRAHYILLKIDSNSDAIDELKRVSKYNENIVRTNIFKTNSNKKALSVLAVSEKASEFKHDKQKEKKLSELEKIIKEISTQDN